MNKEKIFIISGEDSGDLHGAKLMESIKKINPSRELPRITNTYCVTSKQGVLTTGCP